MASRRRTTEDKNTKLLRELAALPQNKQCFDCLQRGPTYINVTIGSFVCTTCSGLLRGLTPPHRVKSISMTTFTPEEIEFLKNRGNEYCKYVWLGTFDTSSNSIESEIYNDQKKRDFMIQKYEKKRWYVEPDVAIKKMQAAGTVHQRLDTTNSANKSAVLPETQPLSRLLGKNVAPLVVQSNQSREIWPHPVSSASAPTISTKTTAQNHGSRSIDLLSELAGGTSTAKSQENSTANGNFANFETAFSSNDKSVTTTPQPSMPTSASLDAYPMQSHHQFQNTFQAFSPTSPPSQKTAVSVSTTSNSASQQSTTDRYAALADLDSLFNQPAVSTKAPSWTVKVTSSGSLFETPAAAGEKNGGNLYSTAPSNPFASTNLWSQKPQNSYQSANPFQTGTENVLSYSQTASSQVYAPFPIPTVGNSPSDDGIRSQFNANFAAFPNQLVSSPTNGYGQYPHHFQNGGIASPTTSSGMWGIPVWSSSQVGPSGGLFSNEVKSTESAQHSDWIQNPVNPFTVPSNNLGYSVTPKTNCGNPFL